MAGNKMSRMLVLFAVCFTLPVSAQISQPRRHDTQSPTGVSYRSGAFNLAEEDLSIGGPGPEGLSLRRIYNSSLSGNGGMLDAAVGWSDNFASSINNHPVAEHPDFAQTPPNQAMWIYNVAVGGKTYGFTGGTTGGSVQAPSHVLQGSYSAISKTGAQLVFNATSATIGTYLLTEADGTVTTFTPYGINSHAANITYPDGTVIEYGYDSNGRLRSIFSSRGYALLFDRPNTACVVNRANIYVTPTSSCPTGVQAVTYGYTLGTFLPSASLLTSVTKGGATTTYSYAGSDKLSCVKDPGASVCRISNQYTICYRNNWDPSDSAFERRWSDFIASQQTATGQTYTYAINPSPCPNWNQGENNYYPWEYSGTVVTANDGSQTAVTVSPGGAPYAVVDQLGRANHFLLEDNQFVREEAVDPSDIYDPEGNITSLLRDDRGNVLRSERIPKPGSTLPSIITTAGYATTCTNTKTCNKPNWVKDAKGSQIDFSYDPAHGGVVTETAPADANGIRAMKRYAYVQRTAWVKDSGSGYVQAGAPLWLLSEMRTCRTTATAANACVGGTADEVVTAYDYGPNSGPNNLWLRGVAVTADNSTLRTCYGYDKNGNRIWETKPRAGLAVCQ